MPFSWRWSGGTISLNLGVIWEMSDKTPVARAPLMRAGPASRDTPGTLAEFLSQSVSPDSSNHNVVGRRFGLKRCQHKAGSLARSRIEAQNIHYMGNVSSTVRVLVGEDEATLLKNID